jgi:flagellar motor switch protein FliN/FliY
MTKPTEGTTKPTDGISRSVIDNLPVTVEAILGFAEISVGELGRLGPGETVKLDSLLGDPVQLRLNGTVVAYGELVSVGDNFAVRIQSIAQP